MVHPTSPLERLLRARGVRADAPDDAATADHAGYRIWVDRVDRILARERALRVGEQNGEVASAFEETR